MTPLILAERAKDLEENAQIAASGDLVAPP